MSLIEMSLSGSAMILLALTLRLGLKGRLPGWLMPAVWWATAARLLLPFEIPTPWSIYNLLERETVSETALPLPDAGAAAGQSTSVAVHQGAAVQGMTTHSVPWHILWAIGFAACAAALLWFWLDGRRKFRESLPVQTAEVKNWLSRHPLHRKLQVRQSDRIDSPLTYGLFRPVILLPARRDWSSKELECVLTHEYTHIRHLDSLSKLILLAAACLHWFNPLAWGMVLLANRDLELWCDEVTVGRLGKGQRKVYALTLIRLEEVRTVFPPAYNYFTTNPLSERIESIMKGKKISLLVTGFALLLVIGISAVFATSAQAEEALPSVQSGPVQEDSSPVISSDVPQDYLDTYGKYGLTYDSDLQRFRYKDKLVRYFEDMYPINEDGSEKAGTVVQMPDGEVDVYSVRNFSNLTRNPDGSYDPSGQLTGLREATQEEFDNVTALLEENRLYVDRGKSYAGEAVSSWADEVELKEDTSAESAEKLVEDEITLTEAAAEESILHQEEAEQQAEAEQRKAQEEIRMQEELTAFVQSFANVYLSGDETAVESYLVKAYDWGIDLYSGTAQVEGLSLTYGGDVADGSTANASVTLLPKGGDSYEYLSIELVMEEGSWKVSFYGLEK